MPAARKARLTVDAFGVAIQGSLRPRDGGGQNVDVHAHSHTSTIITGAQIVRLVSTVGCHLMFGEVDTTAAIVTDMLLPANVPEYFNIDGLKYIATFRDGGVDGSLNIQIME